MDPSRGRALLAKPADQAASIGYRDARFLITTVGGGGSKYLDWDYNSNVRWQSKGPYQVDEERFGEWSPANPPRNNSPFGTAFGRVAKRRENRDGGTALRMLSHGHSELGNTLGS